MYGVIICVPEVGMTLNVASGVGGVIGTDDNDLGVDGVSGDVGNPSLILSSGR